MKLLKLSLGLVSLFGITASAQELNQQYIVQIKDDSDANLVQAWHGLSSKFVYHHAIHGFTAKIPDAKLKALQDDPRVKAIVPDREINAIGKPSPQGSTPPNVQITPAGVQHIGAAPGNLTFTGAGIGVAIVDTGLDVNHNDLQPLGAASYSSFAGSAQDNNGHGTHVGGIVAARNNSIDVVGVAPRATLYAVKVLDASGSGSDSSVIAGLDWVAQNAASVSPTIRVVNMSLGRVGSLDDNPILHSAVQALVSRGIAVVVAAGNDSSLEVSQQVPATYPEVIAVASTTALNGTNQYRKYNGVIQADTASYFTTDGAMNVSTGIGVTISAPGEDQEDINKAGFVQSLGILSTKLGGGTIRYSGTSMAAPHVTGVIALLQEAAAGALTPEEARTKIILGASNPNAPLDSSVSGYTFDGDREGILSAPGSLAAPSTVTP